jgi:hypothetical protein
VPTQIPRVPTQGHISYQTTNILNKFWQALDVWWLAHLTTTASMVVPVVYRPTANPEVYEILQDKKKGWTRSITSFWLTLETNSRNWTLDEAKSIMIDQTMLHLREHIKLKQLHANPLQRWLDAHWIYNWYLINPKEVFNT